jgi:hypothetical protein
MLQSIVNKFPVLAARIGDRAGFPGGPGSGALVVLIRPAQDLLLRERRQTVAVAVIHSIGEKLRQGATPWKSSESIPKGSVNARPRLEARAGNAAISFGGKSAGGLAVNGSPEKNILDREWTEAQFLVGHVQAHLI